MMFNSFCKDLHWTVNLQAREEKVQKVVQMGVDNILESQVLSVDNLIKLLDQVVLLVAICNKLPYGKHHLLWVQAQIIQNR